MGFGVFLFVFSSLTGAAFGITFLFALYTFIMFFLFSPPSIFFSSAACQLRQGHNILYTILHIIK